MTLRGWLRNWLAPDLRALEERVEALEALQLKREVAWAEARDAIYRHVQRAEAIEQRRAQREGGSQDAARTPLSTVLAAKFGGK